MAAMVQAGKVRAIGLSEAGHFGGEGGQDGGGGAVGADAAFAEERIVGRHLLHLRDYLGAVVGLVLVVMAAHAARGILVPDVVRVDVPRDLHVREVVPGVGVAERLARTTGLTGSFVGTVFMSVATTLPEMAVTLSALRLGADRGSDELLQVRCEAAQAMGD